MIRNIGKKQSGLTVAALFLAASFSAHATTYHYDYTYDGSFLTTNQSAAGASIAPGDVVNLVLHTQGGYWSATAGQSLWAPVAVVEQTTRVGNWTWSFLLNGVVQDSGSVDHQESQFSHIVNYTNASTAVDFNEFRWSYTLTEVSSGMATTLGQIFFTPNPFYDDYRPEFNFGTPSTVPVPAASWLLGSGLMGLAGIARRKSGKR